MTTPEFESILKKARPPEIPAESLEMFPRQIVARLKRGDPVRRENRNPTPRLTWAFAVVACIIIAFAVGQHYGRLETGMMAQNDDSLANVKLIHETLAMFPHQVRAITEDAHGLNLILSQTGDVPTSPPIYVRICDGKQCASVVTFSGQEVQIAGQTLTVLSGAQGGIILTGDHFVWSNTERIYANNHLKIEAKNLGPAAM